MNIAARGGRNSPLPNRALALAVGGAAVHLLHVGFRGGRTVVVVVCGGAALLRRGDVAGEAAEEALLFLRVAGRLRLGKVLLPREARGCLDVEAERLRVLAPEAPRVGLRRGQRSTHDLMEECLLRVDWDGACPLP